MSVKLTWYGHSVLGLETGGYKILIDPYLTENPASTITPESVSPDFILITHGHFDHIGNTVEIAKRTGALVIANFEIATWLGNQGVQAHAQHVGGAHTHPFGNLKFTQALHGSMLPDGANGGNPVGFYLTTNAGEKVYISGDTGLFSDMRLIGEQGIDLATLPIGDNFTMGPQDALRAVKFLEPRHVVPIHYDTWELIAQDAQDWARQVQAQTGAQVHVIKPGESYNLD